MTGFKGEWLIDGKFYLVFVRRGKTSMTLSDSKLGKAMQNTLGDTDLCYACGQRRQ